MLQSLVLINAWLTSRLTEIMNVLESVMQYPPQHWNLCLLLVYQVLQRSHYLHHHVGLPIRSSFSFPFNSLSVTLPISRALFGILSYFGFRRRIPLAALLLDVVMDIANHHKSVYVVAFAALFLQGCLSVWYVFTTIAIYDRWTPNSSCKSCYPS